jgi:hypothetical protein
MRFSCIDVFLDTGNHANVACNSASRSGDSTAARKRRLSGPVDNELHPAVRLVTIFATNIFG